MSVAPATAHAQQRDLMPGAWCIRGRNMPSARFFFTRALFWTSQKKCAAQAACWSFPLKDHESGIIRGAHASSSPAHAFSHCTDRRGRSRAYGALRLAVHSLSLISHAVSRWCRSVLFMERVHSWTGRVRAGGQVPACASVREMARLLETLNDHK